MKFFASPENAQPRRQPAGNYGIKAKQAGAQDLLAMYQALGPSIATNEAAIDAASAKVTGWPKIWRAPTHAPGLAPGVFFA